MVREWGQPVADLLAVEDTRAALQLRDSLGFDVFTQPGFWEAFVALRLGGVVTPKQCQHDVEVADAAIGVRWRAEVKFSRAFWCRFSSDSAAGPRNVFKWALPRGNAGKDSADAVVLLGLDVDGLVFSWIVPTIEIAPRCASITVTAPSSRDFGHPGRWDRWGAPVEQLLPAFLDRCHLTRWRRKETGS